MYQIYFILEWHSTCFGRSFRPSSGVRYCCLLVSGYTLASRQQYLFDICLLLYVQSWNADDGRKDRPKHVDCHSKIQQIWHIGTSSWFYYLLTPWCRVLLEQLTGFAASQEIHRISRNPKVHYRTHKRPPTVSILGQPNPVHIPTSHLLEIHPNIIHPSTSRSPQWSPSLLFLHQDTIHPLSSHICTTCPFSSLLGTHILLNKLFSNTLDPRTPWMSATKFHTHTKKVKILVLYILLFKFLNSKSENKRFCTER